MIALYRYNAHDYIVKNKELSQAIDQIEYGFFTPDQPDLFKDVANVLRNHDRFVLFFFQKFVYILSFTQCFFQFSSMRRLRGLHPYAGHSLENIYGKIYFVKFRNSTF